MKYISNVIRQEKLKAKITFHELTAKQKIKS